MSDVTTFNRFIKVERYGSKSMVDMTIRLMIADDTIKKHALLTLNVGDFNDVCLTKNVEMITRKC